MQVHTHTQISMCVHTHLISYVSLNSIMNWIVSQVCLSGKRFIFPNKIGLYRVTKCYFKTMLYKLKALSLCFSVFPHSIPRPDNLIDPWSSKPSRNQSVAWTMHTIWIPVKLFLQSANFLCLLSLKLCIPLRALLSKGCMLESTIMAQQTSQKLCHPTNEAAHSRSVLSVTELMPDMTVTLLNRVQL